MLGRVPKANKEPPPGCVLAHTSLLCAQRCQLQATLHHADHECARNVDDAVGRRARAGRRALEKGNPMARVLPCR